MNIRPAPGSSSPGRRVALLLASFAFVAGAGTPGTGHADGWLSIYHAPPPAIRAGLDAHLTALISSTCVPVRGRFFLSQCLPIDVTLTYVRPDGTHAEVETTVIDSKASVVDLVVPGADVVGPLLRYHFNAEQSLAVSGGFDGGGYVETSADRAPESGDYEVAVTGTLSRPACMSRAGVTRSPSR